MRELRRTCENDHALIWHREWVCPLCEASERVKKLEELVNKRAVKAAFPYE